MKLLSMTKQLHLLAEIVSLTQDLYNCTGPDSWNLIQFITQTCVFLMPVSEFLLDSYYLNCY